MDWKRLELSDSLKMAGKPDEALSELRELVQTPMDPEEGAIVRMAMAHCLRDLRRPEEARQPLLEAYAMLDHKGEVYPRVMFVEALVEEDQGNWQTELNLLDGILSKYAKVLENPDHQDLREEVHRHRGIALLGLGRHTEAMPLLDAARSEEYDRDLTLDFLGQCYFALGQLEQAKQSFREALSVGLRPGCQVDVHYRLGVIHYRLGEFAWALKEFEWCCEHRKRGDISEDLILKGLTATLKALGRDEEAERHSRMSQ